MIFVKENWKRPFSDIGSEAGPSPDGRSGRNAQCFFSNLTFAPMFTFGHPYYMLSQSNKGIMVSDWNKLVFITVCG